MPDIVEMTKRPVSRLFRRAMIKRRSASTGLFESTWQDISKDIKKWGSISIEIDAQRLNVFKFSNAQLTVENHTGRYNDESYDTSIWYGYASRNRSLLKIECGFLHETQTTGLWTRTEYPTSSQVFYGIILGDLPASDSNDLKIDAYPISQIFREYPARLLTGWTSTGITASQFITMIRDQTDGGGSYIFRQFFATTTDFNFTTTSNIYSNLNTSGAADVIDANVWQIVEKLAEAEVFVTYIDKSGVFHFKPRPSGTASTASYFFGNGFFNSTYGNIIKKINRYGPDSRNFYSRVQVRWNDADTTTSFAVVESSLTVAGNNLAWNYGLKTYQINNNWIPNGTVAGSIASAVFNNVSSLKKELQFTTSFITHLNVLDVVEVSYNSTGYSVDSGSWDVGGWADTAGGSSLVDDLIWDASNQDPLAFLNKEFRINSISINLDSFETVFSGKET